VSQVPPTPDAKGATLKHPRRSRRSVPRLYVDADRADSSTEGVTRAKDRDPRGGWQQYFVSVPLTVGRRHAEAGDVVTVGPDGEVCIHCRAHATSDEIADLVSESLLRDEGHHAGLRLV
jgi:hypothetical protein